MLRTFKFCANFRSFSSCKNISSVPFNSNSHFPLTVPGNYPSTFCLYESGPPRCFILSGIIQYFSFLADLFYSVNVHKAIPIVSCVRIPFLLMVNNTLLWVPTILAYTFLINGKLVLLLCVSYCETCCEQGFANICSRVCIQSFCVHHQKWNH